MAASVVIGAHRAERVKRPCLHPSSQDRSGDIMPRRVELTPHLDAEEIRVRLQSESDSTVVRWWQVIHLIAQGYAVKEVAELTAFHPQHVYNLIWRYNRQGPDAFVDGRRRHTGGRPPLLNEEQLKAFKRALKGAAPDGGSWSGPKAARWISEYIGRPVHPQRGWEYLKRCGHPIGRAGRHRRRVNGVAQDI